MSPTRDIHMFLMFSDFTSYHLWHGASTLFNTSLPKVELILILTLFLDQVFIFSSHLVVTANLQQSWRHKQDNLFVTTNWLTETPWTEFIFYPRSKFVCERCWCPEAARCLHANLVVLIIRRKDTGENWLKSDAVTSVFSFRETMMEP